jgi:hypothetical protein
MGQIIWPLTNDDDDNDDDDDDDILSIQFNTIQTIISRPSHLRNSFGDHKTSIHHNNHIILELMASIDGIL